MNCASHQTVGAVQFCGECGLSMCLECVKTSTYTVDKKAVCQSCIPVVGKRIFDRKHGELTTELDYLNKDKRKRIFAIVINGFFILVGLIAYSSSNDIMALFIFFAIGGIPAAWRMTRSSDVDKIRHKIDDIGEADGGIGNSLVRGFVRLIFVFIIGAIASPIILIVNVFKYMSLSKKIKQIADSLSKL